MAVQVQQPTGQDYVRDTNTEWSCWASEQAEYTVLLFYTINLSAVYRITNMDAKSIQCSTANHYPKQCDKSS